MELESGRLEHHVRREDHAALQDERDALAARLRQASDTEHRLNRALEGEKEQGSQAAAEVKRLNQLLAALEAASAGEIFCLLKPSVGYIQALVPCCLQLLSWLCGWDNIAVLVARNSPLFSGINLCQQRHTYQSLLSSYRAKEQLVDCAPTA